VDKKYRKEVSALYHRVSGFPLGQCAYCDSPREVLDHVPPLRLACDLDLDKFRKNGGQLLLYPSCRDCNAFLGKQRLIDFRERVAFLISAYSDKIEARQWSDDEIHELGRGLRDFIKNRAYRQAELIRKLRSVEDKLLSLPNP
jgi:hypothetical protein